MCNFMQAESSPHAVLPAADLHQRLKQRVRHGEHRADQRNKPCTRGGVLVLGLQNWRYCGDGRCPADTRANTEQQGQRGIGLQPPANP
ncbi:hypothetical protein D3C73_313520 [compost metagenome]